jgi:hypothetical protein
VTYTDAQGRFRLQKVPNKEIRLRAQTESGEWTQKVTPDASELNVKLQTRQSDACSFCYLQKIRDFSLSRRFLRLSFD